MYLFLFFLFNSAFAECPLHQNAFSMVYPAKFIFLSEDAKAKEPQNVPAIIASTILNELRKESPRIVFLGTAKTFSLVKKMAYKNSDRSLVNDKLSLYETQPAQFQQDVFESFYDESSKSLVIRQFEGYTPQNKGPDLDKLPSVLTTENIKARIGSAIKQHDAWLTGVGGNVESTSFGLSFLGSGEFSNENLKLFTSDLFPNIKNIISFDTSWLALGHVDEILVELKSKKDSSGCESTFFINSPKLGLKFEKKTTQAISKLNLQLQKTFDDYKSQLTKASEGMCKIRFIDVPIVYKKSPDSYKRTVYATNYPSLTNGLLIRDRYFVVEVDNKKIRKSIEGSLREIGIKVVWLPLEKILYSEGVVDGYLHCLTNSIRVCD